MVLTLHRCRLILLLGIALVSIGSVGVFFASFIGPFQRVTIEAKYREASEPELRRVAAVNTDPALDELVALAPNQRKDRIAACQRTTTSLTIANGGLGLFHDSFPSIVYGEQHAGAGSPLDVVVRDVHDSEASYPRVWPTPGYTRVGWSTCGFVWLTSTLSPLPDGEVNSWGIVLPLPLIAAMTAIWPVLALRRLIRSRKLATVEGFTPIMKAPCK